MFSKGWLPVAAVVCCWVACGGAMRSRDPSGSEGPAIEVIRGVPTDAKQGRCARSGLPASGETLDGVPFELRHGGAYRALIQLQERRLSRMGSSVTKERPIGLLADLGSPHARIGDMAVARAYLTEIEAARANWGTAFETESSTRGWVT